jgi:hypothetical protein
MHKKQQHRAGNGFETKSLVALYVWYCSKHLYTDTIPVMSRIKEEPKLISAASISANKELKGIDQWEKRWFESGSIR